MQTGIISFANRIVQNIKTNETKDLILKQLYSNYGIKIIQKQYHRLDINNIKYVTNNFHMCCLRSNGNPYYMFFTLYNEIPIIYFIDKKVHPGYQKPRILIVRGMFAESLFNNTLIDGEMVKTQEGKWLFIMNDMIAYEGKHLVTKQLIDRLKLMYEMLHTQYTPDEMVDTCKYQIKGYCYVNQESIQKLIDVSKTLNYSCRGIYMWSSDLRYKNKLVNFNEENIINVVRKVKDETQFQTIETSPKPKEETQNGPIELSSCNDKNKINKSENRTYWFAKTDFPDVYYIYDGENVLTSKRIGTALVPNISTSKALREAFKNTNAAAVVKTDCVYDEKFKKWYPIKIY